jgi:hypothetical protein
MKQLTASALLILAACTTAQDGNEAVPVHGQGACRSEQLNQFVGQKADAALGARILEVSGARVLRWVAPGMAVTMDFRQDRLTVTYDAAYVITQASCG